MSREDPPWCWRMGREVKGRAERLRTVRRKERYWTERLLPIPTGVKDPLSRRALHSGEGHSHQDCTGLNTYHTLEHKPHRLPHHTCAHKLHIYIVPMHTEYTLHGPYTNYTYTLQMDL